MAGAGSCLKRYSDPSFFKAEPASSVTATVEVHRERKIRKVRVRKLILIFLKIVLIDVKEITTLCNGKLNICTFGY